MKIIEVKDKTLGKSIGLKAGDRLLKINGKKVVDEIDYRFRITNEEILLDSLGNLLESPADSYWGEYNDVKQIKITWDQEYLYLAVDACSWDNNVMLFIKSSLEFSSTLCFINKMLHRFCNFRRLSFRI